MVKRGVHRKITESAFFIIIFTILSAIGFSKMVLGISDNRLLENIVNTVIGTSIAILITWIVFALERRGNN